MVQPILTTQSGPPIEMGPPSFVTGPLLLATAGAPDTDAAVIAAQLFAERTHAPVQVLSAVMPASLGYTVGMLPLSHEIDTDQRDAQVLLTHAQLTRLAGRDNAWPVTMEFGEPAQTIANTARLRGARLIIVGHSHHTSADRLLGGDHILQALQLGDTPVFAAMPGLNALPRRVVIATDFSDLSAYAAQFSLSFVAPNASIFLVNVMPDVDAGGGGWEHDWADNYRRGLADAFSTATGALQREALVIEPMTLTGNAADEILRYAREQQADLIVCSAHGQGFLRRLILGSVATRLVRNAECSVLVVPGSAQARAASRPSVRHGESTRSFSATEWSGALGDFSKRNGGRLCSIEVDQSDVGAQVEGTSVRFEGAAYDPRDNSVALMFGETADRDHFTHSVRDVNGIDVRTDTGGADLTLRVTNRSGQTMVSLESSPRFVDERDNY